MANIAALGRLPELGMSFRRPRKLRAALGSVMRAFALANSLHRTEEWDGITQRCTEIFSSTWLLGRFRRRPPMSILPRGLQRDLRAFVLAIHMLANWPMRFFSRPARPSSLTKHAGNRLSANCCPNVLYVHRNALDGLSPLLRV